MNLLFVLWKEQQSGNEKWLWEDAGAKSLKTQSLCITTQMLNESLWLKISRAKTGKVQELLILEINYSNKKPQSYLTIEILSAGRGDSSKCKLWPGVKSIHHARLWEQKLVKSTAFIVNSTVWVQILWESEHKKEHELNTRHNKWEFLLSTSLHSNWWDDKHEWEGQKVLQIAANKYNSNHKSDEKRKIYEKRWCLYRTPNVY